MKWRWGVLVVAWAACLGACALVSGLSSLDVGVVDASVTKDGTAVEASTEAAVVDAGADVTVVADGEGPSVLHCGPDASCAFNQQSCCAKSASYQCVDKNGCSGDGSAVLACDYGGHCTNGTICCLQAGNNLSPTITCRQASECKGAAFNYQLCRTSAECPDGGKCTSVPTASWISFCN